MQRRNQQIGRVPEVSIEKIEIDSERLQQMTVMTTQKLSREVPTQRRIALLQTHKPYLRFSASDPHQGWAQTHTKARTDFVNNFVYGNG